MTSRDPFVCVYARNLGFLPSFQPHYCEDSLTVLHSHTSLWGSSSPFHVRPQTPWRTCSRSWGCPRSRPTASLGADLWGEPHGCTHSWRAPPLCKHGLQRSPPLLRWWHKWMLFLDCLQTHKTGTSRHIWHNKNKWEINHFIIWHIHPLFFSPFL